MTRDGLPSTRILLLVEDNSADADLVIDMLDSVPERSRYEVLHVPNLAEAEKLLSVTKVDVVLLDLRLPDGSGIDCVTSVLNAARDVPIVVLTGIVDERLGQDCIDAGAQDYLNKDEISPTQLRRAIGFAITRLRESQLRELQAHLANYRALSSDGAITTVTASLAGVGPIKHNSDEAFQAFIKEYADLLDEYLEQLGYRREKPKEMMEKLATSIGDRGAGPRDLLDIHVAALERAMGGASIERARALVVEGRLLALEMMGLLVDYYRVGNRRRATTGGIR